MKLRCMRHRSAAITIALLALFLALCGTAIATGPIPGSGDKPKRTRRPRALSVRVAGDVHVTPAGRALGVTGRVAVHSDGRPLPVSGKVEVEGPVPISGSVTVTGPVVAEPPPDRILASGNCNSNGSVVIGTLPNSPDLRITSVHLTGIAATESDARLSIIPPGGATPVASLFVQFGGNGLDADKSLVFTDGLSDSHAGAWQFRCGSTNNDSAGGWGSWMVLGR